MTRWALECAEAVYRDFLEEVLEGHVLKKDRHGPAPHEKARRKIEQGTHVDPRALRLMTISGKGGYVSDPEKRKKYAAFRNISLLDHLLSVTRGAMVFAALDYATRNPDMERDALLPRLTIIAAVAFLHDIDKDLQLERNTALSLEHAEERMARYGLSDFMKTAGVEATPDQLRYLIEKVEATQAHRHPPEVLPPREWENLPRYVRLADQLDSTWVNADPESGGTKGVLAVLASDQACRLGESLTQWREVRIFDPLHPFLLDELQRFLSRCCLRIAGVPPLIETHLDGELFLLLPAGHYDEIVRKGLDALSASLPFNLYLDVSNRGIPSLYNGRPTHEELEKLVFHLDARSLQNLFRVKKDLRGSVESGLDELLAGIGISPRWPAKFSGQLLPVYASIEDLDPESMSWLRRAAHLALVLNLKVEAKSGDKIPTNADREAELLRAAEAAPPEWIASAADDVSRRTLAALWLTAMAAEDERLLEAVWGTENGLLRHWMEGSDQRPGLNRFIAGQDTAVIREVACRYERMLHGHRVAVEDETAAGRCIFTDEPVPFDKTISQATGLYGVKVSAFSGREGRPESPRSEIAHTNVGAASLAEHRIRAGVHEIQGGRDNGVPTLISSPSTTGLFGGLALKDDKGMGAMSVYDLSRLEIAKGRVLRGAEMYQGRYRMCRLERMPEKLADQADMLRLLLIACHRLGRPLHIFRGLPMPTREFFHYDAMPRVLAELVGGHSLCLEQLPEAIHRLGIANALLETNGLGTDTLKAYAMPATRFGAACMAWCHLRDREEKKFELSGELETVWSRYLEGESRMNERDGALVRLGRAGAGIQKNPGGASASTSDELLVFNLCLEAVAIAGREGQTDRQSLIHAVTGELETNLTRRDKAAARGNRDGKSLMEGCEEVAGLFVDEVWLGVMKGHFPPQKSRRVLSSIYRVAFLKAHREISERKREAGQDKKEAHGKGGNT